MPEGTREGTSPQVNFRPGEIEDALRARAGIRGSLGLTAQRDLDRYYVMLRRALPKFSVGEACMIVDVLNGTRFESYTVHLLYAEIEDSLEDGYAQKWHVDDGPALVERLHRLSPFEAMAVVDASERFWNLVEAGDTRTNAQRVKYVGLVDPDDDMPPEESEEDSEEDEE